jgi:O-acetyl-ADP-ribose deacetylase (regulator of RNase III)
MPFEIVRNNIVDMNVDAIVNAANTELEMGGGVCGSIFKAAGAEELQKECRGIGGCRTGEAVITKGYDLPARYIIHTPGPVWRGGEAGEERLLHNCYISSLNLALEHGCESVAFPLISSGIYGFPKDKAIHTAVTAIGEFLLAHEMTVYLVVFDHSAFVLSEKLFSAIKEYIDDRYAEDLIRRDPRRTAIHIESRNSGAFLAYNQSMPASPKASARKLTDVVSQLDETFSEMLLRLIDNKGMTDAEAYKRANIDRRLFSKIRGDKHYSPSKTTAIAFAIALRLSRDETMDLLAKAGYTLSRSSKADAIIEYFIREGVYNIYEINEALFAFDQKLLGA